MSDLGLRYGDEFRCVRKLSAASGESAGHVAVSDAIAPRAGDYLLHPVLLDGALHVFSAGRSTLEARDSQLKLPVRFGRILFLRSPGASTKVCANVIQCTDDFVEGRISLYDESGEPCVLVDNFRAVNVAGVRRPRIGAGRDVLYHVAWERTSTASQCTTCPPPPLERVRDVARSTLENVIAIRGSGRLEAVVTAQDDLAAALLCAGFRDMGVESGKNFTADSLRVDASMRPIFERLMLKLEERGLLEIDGANCRATSAFTAAATSALEVQRAFICQHPGHLPEALLVAGSCGELSPILRGEKDAVEVLFAGVGAELLDQFYGGGLLASHWLAAMAAAVQEVANVLPEGRGLRILEVGAGTGGLTAQVLPVLERGLHSYIFRYLSGVFPRCHAKAGRLSGSGDKSFRSRKAGH